MAARRGAGESFVVPFGTEKSVSLQTSFLEYKRQKKEQIKQVKKFKQKALKTKASHRRMQELREKFLETAFKYVGTPYARKYWSKEEAEYKSPLFLDCCGLVRRVMRDMQDDFGFKIGPWNQAYQFDTLPITINSTKEMKPGDLVFIAATYNNPKSKKQCHDMVHVEIWTGQGNKTLGARWQRGKVQVHDSYKFDAKSYHTPTYIFKSIDTWLKGICKSFCDKHRWKLRKYEPTKKSVFYDSEPDCDENDEQQAGDTDEEMIKSWDNDSHLADQISKSAALAVKSLQLQGESVNFANGENQPDQQTDKNDHLPAAQGSSRAGECKNAVENASKPYVKGSGNGNKKKQSSDNQNGASNNKSIYRISSLTSSQCPTFYIAGGNGATLVDNYLTSLGWKRLTDKHNFSWKLKWVECNGSINFGAFRDGEQLINRIPNCGLLTNKLGLYNSLSEYSRVMGALKGDRVRLKMEDFVPETYRIDQLRDRDAFLTNYKDGEIWICKPVGLNQGKGIFLMRSREELEKMIMDREERKLARRTRPLMSLIAQRYIEKPMLLEGKKFDIRAYMLIASTIPYLVLYKRGYVRVTCDQYDAASSDISTHLTNQLVQKKRGDYQESKEDTVWSMEKLNTYVNENLKDEHALEEDWVYNNLEKQMRSIMKYCFNSVKHKLTCRLGFFDLYGFDFMLDESLRTWLIEVNVNPALHVNCDVLKEVIPPIVEETIDIAIEVFEKSKRNLPILPLQSLQTFQILHNGCTKSYNQSSSEPGLTTAPSPRVQPRRSYSPTKDSSWGYISKSPIKSTKSQTLVIATSEQEVKSPLLGGNRNSNNSAMAYKATPSARAARQTFLQEQQQQNAKSPEEIVKELKEYRPKTPRLPPLYTAKSNVAPSSPAKPSSPMITGAGKSNCPAEIVNQGSQEAPSSPVRLCMVHMAYAPGQAKNRHSAKTWANDRAS